MDIGDGQESSCTLGALKLKIQKSRYSMDVEYMNIYIWYHDGFSYGLNLAITSMQGCREGKGEVPRGPAVSWFLGF